MIPILFRVQKILIPGSSKERSAIYRQGPILKTEILYYIKKNRLGIIYRGRNNSFHLETIVDTKVSEENSGGGIPVVQVLLIKKIYKEFPTIELHNNKKLINT
jgi:hypothetical protein